MRLALDKAVTPKEVKEALKLTPKLLHKTMLDEGLVPQEHG